MDETTRTPRWLLATTFLLVLLVAAGLRLYRLPELPLGLHYDEAANGILASEIAQGVKFPAFIPSYTGKEVLFFYWAALWIKLLGATPLALRISAVLAGLATVAATVWAVRELLHDRRGATWVALLTAAFLATSFWHLVLSRYGFRAVTQPLMQALTVAALWRGLRLTHSHRGEGLGEGGGKGILWFLLAGVFCGLTAYTYLAARAFPIPLAAALLVFLIADRRRWRARLGQLAIFVAAAALALAPLAYYWLTHPGSFLNRTQQVAAASWAEVWSGIRACLGMFFLRGDPYIRFNLPHRPLFDPITAALFILGIVVLIAGRKSVNQQIGKSANPQSSYSLVSLSPCLLASCVFLLVSLPVMLLPSALATGEITPSNLRAAGLLPFIYIFPALGLWTILDLFRRVSLPRLRLATCYLPLATCLLLLLLSGLATACAYFGRWAVSPGLYYAADGDLVDVAAYLNRADLDATTPYIASIHYRHPTLAFLAEDYADIRWLTGGHTLVFPAEGDGLLVFPRSASQDLSWVESVLPSEALTAAPPGPDGVPAFHVYRLGAGGDLAPANPLTANLAHTVSLLGYDVYDGDVGTPRSGESAQVAVWWRVTNVPDRGDYGPIARLVDSWGFAWGYTGPFHYPAEQWTPGEIVVDHLSIPVDAGAPPGDYAVRFSMYSPQAESLLPVLDGAGQYAGTRALLPLHLARASESPGLGELDIRERLDASVDGLTLLGVNLDTASVRPGEPLYLTLFWRAEEAPLLDYDVALKLGDGVLYADAPVHGAYPTSGWTAGEVVVDRYDPRIPRDALPGDYPLLLRVGDLSLTLGRVAVQAINRTFDVPSISHPLAGNLGDQVELLGYDLSAGTVAPGDTLTLTLYWRALAEMDESYTVFTHLVAPDGSVAGQRDSLPVGGAYPTTLWLPGEVVAADVYEIPVRVDATPGEHRLEVGMYVAETGRRLPVVGASEDSTLLQAITVVER